MIRARTQQNLRKDPHHTEKEWYHGTVGVNTDSFERRCKFFTPIPTVHILWCGHNSAFAGTFEEAVNSATDGCFASGCDLSGSVYNCGL